MNVRGVARFLDAVKVAPEVLEAANLEAMSLAVRSVEGAAKARVPRRTGRLFSSIDGQAAVKGPGWVQGRVGTSVEYGKFVELGTAPHEIAPLSAVALVFPIAGHTVYAQHINHPGTRARRYLSDAIEQSQVAVLGFFRNAATKLATHLAKG